MSDTSASREIIDATIVSSFFVMRNLNGRPAPLLEMDVDDDRVVLFQTEAEATAYAESNALAKAHGYEVYEWSLEVEVPRAAVWRVVKNRHRLKTDLESLLAIKHGEQKAVFCKDDPDFNVGEVLLLLNEYDGGLGYDGVEAVISHIVRGPAFGIPNGYAMLSFRSARPYRS